MANEQNLIKNEDLTPKQRRENASKAGKASAKKRAARKTLKDELLLLLATGNMQEKISTAMLEEALSGNVKAFIAIRDTIGEKPKEKVEIEKSNNEMAKEIDDHIKKRLKNEKK